LKSLVSKDEYENVRVEWISGRTPTAYFYDENEKELHHAEMSNMNFDEIEEFFLSNNFPLHRRGEPYDEAKAVQVSWGGHVYELHPESNPYSNALHFSQSKTVNGQQGYMVAINSLAEQQFVDSLLAQNDLQTVWLGGSDKKTEASWIWNGGEEAGELFWTVPEDAAKYANWVAHEPNNAGGDEDCLIHKTGHGWNDVNCVEEKHPLLIEFGNDAQSVPTNSDPLEL